MERAESMNDKSECPYGANDCPKINQLSKEVSDTKATMLKMMKTLYLIAGILTINLGITIL